MKPMIILAPDTVSVEDIKKLEDNDICVVVVKDPATLRFMDPLPALSNRTEMEQAAIKLSRLLIHKQHTGGDCLGQKDIIALYVALLVKGTSLDSKGSVEEQEKVWAESARHDEVCRMAREEARAKREAAKKLMEPKTAGLWKPGGPGRPPKSATTGTQV